MAGRKGNQRLDEFVLLRLSDPAYPNRSPRRKIGNADFHDADGLVKRRHQRHADARRD